MKVLHKFHHGLGDCVQFTTVLRHLAAQRPDWENHVQTHPGKDSLFRDLAACVWTRDPDPALFDQVIDHAWPENWTSYPDYPSTKAVRCIAEQLRLTTVPELLRYTVGVRPECRDRVLRDFVDLLPEAKGFVCIHYQGHTSGWAKDVGEDLVAEFCKLLLAHRYVAVILDWDRRSRLPDQRTIFCPGAGHPLWLGYGAADGETLAALLGLAALNVCIDSGPQKMAMAVPPPLIAVWREHHPVHFAEPHPNTIHLVHRHAEALARGSTPWAAHRYFLDHYDHHVYTDLLGELVRLALDRLHIEPLQANPMSRGHLLHAHAFDRAYYEEHRAAGLDYLGHGAWQEEYGRWLAESLQLTGTDALDIGCACGSIAWGMHQAGLRIHGIDLNEYMIHLGRKRFPLLPLDVCDGANLHLFGPESFDFVHAHQVAEHWKGDLVPVILREVYRVLKPGGLFFSVLDTADLMARQHRDGAGDVTHHTLRPLSWWREQLAGAGFEPADPAAADALRGHTQAFFRRYDWDWWLVRRPQGETT